MSSRSSPLLAYITFPSRRQAMETAAMLVENRLAAGANVLQGATSIYRWEGKIRQREEWLLFAQTTAEAWDSFVDMIRKNHEDVVPCIVAMKITDGYPPFLNWMDENTGICESR